MMMMMRRVMCVLAVVLCTVSVSGATSSGEGTSEIVEELKNISNLAQRAILFVEKREATKVEIVKLKAQCSNAATNAADSTREAREFVQSIDQFIKTAETRPSVLEAEKKKGSAVLEKVKKAAADARNATKLTKAATITIIEYGLAARQLLIDFIYKYDEMNASMKNTGDSDKLKQLETLHKKVETAFHNTNHESVAELSLSALITAEDADEAAQKAEAAVEPAETAANLLEKALENLTTAIYNAEERNKDVTPLTDSRQIQQLQQTNGDTLTVIEEKDGESSGTNQVSTVSDATATAGSEIKDFSSSKGITNTHTELTNTTASNSPAALDTNIKEGSQETNSTTLASTTNTVSEATATTLSPIPVTDPQISSIASTVKNKANVDSSVNPLWMRTAAPFLIVVVLFSATVY
ncbi:uncharacterized protein TM35_000451630 [Trypanosoma theileri]|uniref:Uncharacterized protein n=1 Tax=Trypanosoma theileri TaxID=67003 RepID=A0A1X0NI67_9TRYP|nr:uncharacterized protein TM35_000451630 [Trypanosoma theileri]ORC84425.1 hypothetical protein TM35_000451630 [Trypanosoma theileri]